MVHTDEKTKEKTLCNFLLEEFPEVKDVGDDIRRPGIVHRLDKETSGVIVVARNQKSFESLKKQFQEHTIRKTYNTFLWGHVKEDEGVIKRAIGRSKNDFRKWSAQRFARGEMREAITEYKVLKRIDSDPMSLNNTKIPSKFTFLEAYPLTGRTHQIRVHFKAINHPVVGDMLYAENHPYALGFKRLALHSRKIKLKMMSGEDREFEAMPPKDFEKIISCI